jgi:hypothetical protein
MEDCHCLFADEIQLKIGAPVSLMQALRDAYGYKSF